MARVARPPHGSPYKFKGPYVVGYYLIDGRRSERSLGKLAALERTEGGHKRTPRQLDAAIQRQWEEKLAELEEALPVAGSLGIGDAFNAWIEGALARGVAPGTVEIHRLCRDYYLDIVGDHPLEEPVGSPPRPTYNTRHAERFVEALRSKGLGPTRINMYLGRLSSMLRAAYRRGELWRLPIIERVRERRERVKVPTREDLRAVMARLDKLAFDPEARLGTGGQEHRPSARQRYYYELHRLLLYLLLGTGMRRGEAYYLRWEQIDPERRLILLVKTKTGKPRACIMPVFLKERLAAHAARHPGQVLVFEHPEPPKDTEGARRHAWHAPSAMTTAFGRHMAKLGLAGGWKVLHGYRALFSTAGLNEVGVDAAAMREQLGHADIRTTLAHYVARLDEAQLRAVDKMEAEFFADLFGEKQGKSVPALS